MKKKTPIEFSPYWHKEVWVAIPFMVVWTALLAAIAMK